MTSPHDSPTAGGWGSVPPVTQDGRARRLLQIELAVVLLLSLGRSAIYSVVSIIASLTAPGGLAAQSASMHSNITPERPWLDLTYQLLDLGFSLVPVALVGYLLVRSGVSLRRVWWGGSGVGVGVGDLSRGALIAAGVGSVGLVFYLMMQSLGLNATIVADGFDAATWWKIPVLVLSALQNAVLEEVVVLGYVLVRLRQLGFSDWSGIALAALLRGGYHLYQGFGGFLGNVAMGLLFGWLYRRWGRITPLIVAHTLLDVAAFVGYAALAGRVPWLPT